MTTKIDIEESLLHKFTARWMYELWNEEKSAKKEISAYKSLT
jgi:hypothetical protein